MVVLCFTFCGVVVGDWVSWVKVLSMDVVGVYVLGD